MTTELAQKAALVEPQTAQAAATPQRLEQPQQLVPMSPVPQAEGWKPRFRLNAKQTAKGAWQLDCTVEVYGAPGVQRHNPADEGDVSTESISQVMLDVIAETERRFVAQGRQLADPAPVKGA